jgi:hypothetical protein
MAAPAADVQLRFIHWSAAFITRPAAFIPFSFSRVGVRLSCSALQRRSFVLLVAPIQRGSFALANTLPPMTHFEGDKNEDAEAK